MVTLASEPGALDLFWFPMSIFMLGMVLALTRNPIKIQKMGWVLATIGIIFIAISPFTAPKSPSSAFGQLILFLMGPTVLLVLANLISMKYSNIRKNEYVRGIFIVIGLSWIVLIWISNPQFNDTNNEYWLLWVVSVEIISAIILFSQAYLEQKTTAKILFFLLGASLLLLNEEILEIPNASRALFIKASGTIVGTIIGFLSGIIIWFYVVQKLHSLEESLDMDKNLTQDERKLLLDKLKNDLEWLGRFEGGDSNE